MSSHRLFINLAHNDASSDQEQLMLSPEKTVSLIGCAILSYSSPLFFECILGVASLYLLVRALSWSISNPLAILKLCFMAGLGYVLFMMWPIVAVFLCVGACAMPILLAYLLFEKVLSLVWHILLPVSPQTQAETVCLQENSILTKDRVNSES